MLRLDLFVNPTQDSVVILAGNKLLMLEYGWASSDDGGDIVKKNLLCLIVREAVVGWMILVRTSRRVQPTRRQLYHLILANGEQSRQA